MSLSLALTPGYQFAIGEVITEDKLNALGNPAVDLQGTLDEASITPGAVNAMNTEPDAFFFGGATLSGSAISFNANGVQSPAPANYVAGQTYFFLPNFNCPAGGVTVNINSIGAANLYKRGTTALALNDFLSGQLVWIGFDGTNFQLLGAQGLGAAGGVTTKLKHNTTGGTGAFTASLLLLSDAANLTYAVPTVSVSGVSITASGAGGLDTGSAAGSTWYYLHAIWNGTTLSGLLSLSATAPTLPSGYYAWTVICPVFSNSGGTALNVQLGINRSVFIAPLLNYNTTGVSSYTQWMTSTAVPPVAVSVTGVIGFSTSPNAVESIVVAATSSGFAAQAFTFAAGGLAPAMPSPFAYYQCASFTVPITTAQNSYYAASQNDNVQIFVTGYSF